MVRIVGVCAVAYARDDDDGRAGLALPEVAEQLDAAQSGHGDVCDYNVVGLFAYEGEGLLGAACGVAEVLFPEEVVEHVSNRVVVVNGGFRDTNSFELWLVPQGAPPPQPSPTVRPGDVRPAPVAAPRRGRRG